MTTYVIEAFYKQGQVIENIRAKNIFNALNRFKNSHPNPDINIVSINTLDAFNYIQNLILKGLE